MKKIQMTLAAVLCCAMTMVVFTACTDDGDNTIPVEDNKPYNADANKDTSVRPGDDFFMYCNGSFWNNTVADDANPFTKSFMGKINDEMNKRIAALTIPSKVKILADVEKTDAATMTAQKAKMQSAIDRVNAITTREEAWKVMAELYLEGYRTPVDLSFFSVKGKVGLVMNFQSTKDYLASWFLSNDDLSWRLSKDPELLARVRPLKNAATRGFDKGQWPILATFFETLGISLDDVYTIDNYPVMIENGSGDTMTLMTAMLQDCPVEEWKEQLANTLHEDAVYFDDNAAAAVSMTRQDAVNNFMDKYLNYEISHAFANAYVTADQKQRMKEYAEELRLTFRERIQQNTWMGEGSKQNAIGKLDRMIFNIGAPDEWFEEGLADLSQEPTLFDDILSLRRTKFNLLRKVAGMDMQRASFHLAIILMPLTVVNSFYMQSGNYMNILPAYMLSPNFDPQVNDAQNYANMMVWGHEVTHGFDTDGAKYDQWGDYGTLWASDADSQEFLKRAQQLIDYYSSLAIMPFETGLKNDGAFTVAENVADLGGFFLAYDSYVKHLKKQGFKGDQLRLQQQRFYEAYGNLFGGKWTAAEAQKRTVGIGDNHDGKDPHSLFRERVNGVVTNTDDWYDLFDVKADDKLYLAPDKRIRIW